MKSLKIKRLSIFILAFIAIAIMSFTLFACSSNKEDDNQIINSYDLHLNGFDFSNDTYYLTTTEESMDIIGAVSLDSMHAYELYRDRECRNQVVEEKVNLEDGENRYYLLVRSIIDSSSSWQYNIVITREYAKHTITFDSNLGLMGTKQVKDGTTITESDIVVDQDYKYISTEFDFSTEILEDTTVYLTVDYKYYTIVFDSKYGVLDSTEVRSGSTISASDIHLPFGYTYVGSDFDFSTKIRQDYSVTIDVNYRLVTQLQFNAAIDYLTNDDLNCHAKVTLEGADTQKMDIFQDGNLSEKDYLNTKYLNVVDERHIVLRDDQKTHVEDYEYIDFEGQTPYWLLNTMGYTDFGVEGLRKLLTFSKSYYLQMEYKEDSCTYVYKDTKFRIDASFKDGRLSYFELLDVTSSVNGKYSNMVFYFEYDCVQIEEPPTSYYYKDEFTFTVDHMNETITADLIYIANNTSNVTIPKVATHLTSDSVFSGVRYLYFEGDSQFVEMPDNLLTIFPNLYSIGSLPESLKVIDSKYSSKLSLYYYGGGAYATTVSTGGLINSCFALMQASGASVVTINKDAKIIAKRAFKNSSITSVTFGEANISVIQEEAFYGCTSLTSITLNANLKEIKERAFYGCSALKDITFNGTKSQWYSVRKCSESFSGMTGCTVHCLDGDI